MHMVPGSTGQETCCFSGYAVLVPHQCSQVDEGFQLCSVVAPHIGNLMGEPHSALCEVAEDTS